MSRPKTYRKQSETLQKRFEMVRERPTKPFGEDYFWRRLYETVFFGSIRFHRCLAVPQLFGTLSIKSNGLSNGSNRTWQKIQIFSFWFFGVFSASQCHTELKLWHQTDLGKKSENLANGSNRSIRSRDRPIGSIDGRREFRRCLAVPQPFGTRHSARQANRIVSLICTFSNEFVGNNLTHRRQTAKCLAWFRSDNKIITLITQRGKTPTRGRFAPLAQVPPLSFLFSFSF